LLIVIGFPFNLAPGSVAIASNNNPFSCSNSYSGAYTILNTGVRLYNKQTATQYSLLPGVLNAFVPSIGSTTQTNLVVFNCSKISSLKSSSLITIEPRQKFF